MAFWDFFLRASVPQESAPQLRVEPEPVGVTTIPARAVTNVDALSLSMVYRAVQIIGTAISQMSVDAYRGTQQLDPAPAFIRNPDIDGNRRSFLEMTANSLALTGNAFWLVDRDEQNRVRNLKVLNPHDVAIDVTPWGTVTGYQYRGTVYTRDRMKHLALMRVPGQAKGLGPIQAAQSEIRGALDVRDFSAEWFDKAGIPNGILKSDQHLDADTAAQWKTAWHAAQTKHETAVLGNGLSYQMLGLSPKDALWIEARQFDTTAIARLFGVPASLMLAEGGDGSYANVQQDWVAFTRFTLSRFYGEIEQAFTDLLPRGSEAKFNVEALLRADTTTRYQAHAVALESGFLTVDEVRAIEGLQPLPEPAEPAPQPAPAEPPTPEEEPNE